MAETPKRIALIGGERLEEGIAAAAITPGFLIKQNSDGNLIPHGTAGGYAEAAFALEDALQGKTIADAYAIDDLVFYTIAQKGDVIYAWLAEGESADPSEFLTSNGNGTLKVASSTDIRIAAPLETLNNSATAGVVGARIRVRIL